MQAIPYLLDWQYIFPIVLVLEWQDLCFEYWSKTTWTCRLLL